MPSIASTELANSWSPGHRIIARIRVSNRRAACGTDPIQHPGRRALPRGEPRRQPASYVGRLLEADKLRRARRLRDPGDARGAEPAAGTTGVGDLRGRSDVPRADLPGDRLRIEGDGQG